MYSVQSAPALHRSAWTQSRLQLAALGVLVACAYFLVARLSLGLLSPDGVAVFWPAAGVASGTLIALGPAARWPVALGVMAATITANLLGDRNLPSSIVFALANAGEAVLIARLAQLLGGPIRELRELRQVLGLVGATIFASVLSGVAGAIGFVYFHTTDVSPLLIWLHWFTADALGSITVAPLIIGLRSLLRDPPPRREFAESIAAMAVVALVCALFIYLPNQNWPFELSLAALCPMFIWIAARYRPAVSAIAAFFYASTIVWTTIFNLGVFSSSNLSPDERVLAAQAAVLTLAVGALVLASLFSERRRHEEALLEREARIEEALRTGGVLAYRWDLSAQKIRFSPNATELLGLTGEPELAEADWLARVHPDDRREVMMSGHERIRGGQLRTFRYLRPSHPTPVHFEQTSAVEFDGDGRPTHMHGLMSDVSERKEFEQHIVRAQRAAEQANQAKTSFLSAASHDLRQPLQTLRLLQGSLQQARLEGEDQAVVARMGRSLDTMSVILSSLLDINRLETGNIPIAIGDFPIREIFESLASEFAASVQEKGLVLRVVQSGLIVQTDRHMLQEMLRNLLSNALRYTDRGKILIGCRRNGDRIRIEVFDTGIGIADDQLPHIFEEYYQSAQGAERGGFGLGLAIVKRLADLLQHPVEVRSQSGKGAVFSIEVPRGHASRSPAAIEADLPPDRRFAGRVFVIEDESSVRSAIANLFRALGIEAHYVSTANEALAALRDGSLRPDLLICDYNLRGSINGIECVEAVRGALDEKVPAIVISGDMRSKTAETLSGKGMSFLLKPFSTDELIRTMQQAAESAV